MDSKHLEDRIKSYKKFYVEVSNPPSLCDGLFSFDGSVRKKFLEVYAADETDAVIMAMVTEKLPITEENFRRALLLSKEEFQIRKFTEKARESLIEIKDRERKVKRVFKEWFYASLTLSILASALSIVALTLALL